MHLNIHKSFRPSTVGGLLANQVHHEEHEDARSSILKFLIFFLRVLRELRGKTKQGNNPDRLL